MEDKRNVKNVILSVVLIFVAVIGVLLSSYAFFTYSKTGTYSSKITTGSINLKLTEGNSYTLSNQFPQTAAEAQADQSNVGYTFTVQTSSGLSNVGYKVYAVPGTQVAGKERLLDEQVNFALTVSTDGEFEYMSQATPILEFGTDTVFGGTPSFGGAGNENVRTTTSNYTINPDGKILLATVQALSANAINYTYTLKMYVNDSVTISDTDSTADYCARGSSEGFTSQCVPGEGDVTRKVYSNMYYSVKIRLEASENIGGQS